MTYKEKIVQHIIERKGAKRNFVIAVCGAADIGKSYLSKNLIKILKYQGISAKHLTLDSFLMSRPERLKKGISGYDIEAYDFEAIQQLLTNLGDGKTISFFPYNHATGEKEKKLKIIPKSEILIIDGLHSMHNHLKPYRNFSIFVYAEDEYLRTIRREADILKRKQTPKISQNLEPVEYQKYKRLVEPYKDQADLLVFLKRKWQYAVNLNTKY